MFEEAVGSGSGRGVGELKEGSSGGSVDEMNWGLKELGIWGFREGTGRSAWVEVGRLVQEP
jgi:hypothetical protein